MGRNVSNGLICRLELRQNKLAHDDARNHACRQRQGPTKSGIGNRIAGDQDRQPKQRDRRDTDDASAGHGQRCCADNQRDEKGRDQWGFGRASVDGAFKGTCNQRRMDFDAGIDLAHRRCAQIGQAGRRGANQHDPIPKEPRLHPSIEHVGGRDVAKARRRSPAASLEGHQCGGADRDRDARLSTRGTEAEAVGLTILAMQREWCIAEVDSEHRDRQRLIKLVAMLGQ